jgi:sortase (surface protein transpeptidase)
MKTFIAYLVTIATVVAAAIFARTIVEAAIYVPDSTGVLASSTLYHSSSSNSADSNSNDSDIPVPPVSSATVATAAKNVAVIPPAYPVRLDVPALDIDANVQDVGITARGNMGTPNNFTDVGWYTYGSIPGQQGTALIDGHVDNGLGLAGVFKHLSDIQTGDDIYVINHAGQKVHFVVTDIEYYGYEDAPTSEIFGSGQGAPTLKLITCGGNWVPDQKTYDERLVVTAQLVE